MERHFGSIEDTAELCDNCKTKADKAEQAKCLREHCNNGTGTNTAE